jgi:predicted transport protein
MAKTSQEIEKEFIEGLPSFTGKNLNDWMKILKASKIEKRNDIIKWLKGDEGFGHMNASLLAGIYFNNGKPVYASEKDLLENQFAKYENMRPLYEYLKKDILEKDKDVKFIPKKTYISISKKREFAAINIRNGEIRLGMDLVDIPFDETLQKSKLTGPMPRISHMMVIKNDFDVNLNLKELLEIANNKVNN